MRDADTGVTGVLHYVKTIRLAADKSRGDVIHVGLLSTIPVGLHIGYIGVCHWIDSNSQERLTVMYSVDCRPTGVTISKNPVAAILWGS